MMNGIGLTILLVVSIIGIVLIKKYMKKYPLEDFEPVYWEGTRTYFGKETIMK